MAPDHWNKHARSPHEPSSVPGARWIPLNRDKWALVDEEDYWNVCDVTWTAKFYARTIYATSTTLRAGRAVYLHRLIMNAPVGKEVDHINGDGLDCRRSNMRLCTPRQNRQNMRKTNMPKTSTFMGVSWDKSRSKWRAVIKDKRKYIYIGRYDDEMEAAQSYDAAALSLFGEFARVNFPANSCA